MTDASTDRRTSKSERILARIAAAVGGTVVISRSGVPHLVLGIGGTTHSVCYFGKQRLLRVFAPYPGTAQTRTDFKEVPLVIAYFKNISAAASEK